MSWFPQLLCWFSMIHNIPVGTFYCKFSCEQFLMQLLEHLTETVHVANPHPPPHMQIIHISVFPASGRFCDQALGKQDHRGCLQTTTENLSSFIWSGYNQSEKRAGGGLGQGEGTVGNHKHSSFKKIKGGQDLSDASSVRHFFRWGSSIIMPARRFSISAIPIQTLVVLSTKPQAVHQTTEMFQTTGKSPRAPRMNANWILALLQKDSKSGSR